MTQRDSKRLRATRKLEPTQHEPNAKRARSSSESSDSIASWCPSVSYFSIPFSIRLKVFQAFSRVFLSLHYSLRRIRIRALSGCNFTISQLEQRSTIGSHSILLRLPIDSPALPIRQVAQHQIGCSFGCFSECSFGCSFTCSFTARPNIAENCITR